MKCLSCTSLVIIFFIGLIHKTQPTCVWDSDFGFTFNCAFKKSGLFRVRNLGGVKAHFGLGFSVGDELGLAESLSNVEGNKRRSLNVRTGTNTIGFGKDLKPVQQTNAVQKSRPMALTIRPVASTQMTMRQKPPVMHESLAKLQNPIVVGPAYTKPPRGMTETMPSSVPQFKPIPPTMGTPKIVRHSDPNMEFIKAQSFEIHPGQMSTNVVKHRPTMKTVIHQYPSFQAMPSTISRVSTNGVLQNNSPVFQPDPMPIPPSSKLPVIDLMGHTVEELAAAANVSVAVIQAAIHMRQQELIAQQQSAAYHQLMADHKLSQLTSTTTTTTTPAPTTTTTTLKPLSKYPIGGGNKVMNAPKEYYPVGYEKNFDDNFTSKVDLPKTSFHCGDQKHFPGLYADENLGCMVFHVCALTDDGLIMKSFLCPESTLFDQTILKCNWWFYVDCKNSKSLYDSNIPVSKSYQLMKALTFFSNYKNSQSSEDGVNVEALKNSVNGNKPT